eukprot:Polyplicarium_translucidae@DN4618_c0_g1_i1.p1
MGRSLREVHAVALTPNKPSSRQPQANASGNLRHESGKRRAAPRGRRPSRAPQSPHRVSYDRKALVIDAARKFPQSRSEGGCPEQRRAAGRLNSDCKSDSEMMVQELTALRKDTEADRDVCGSVEP